MKPRLTLIAAMDERRLITNARGIPWRLPRDVRHFRHYSCGKWLLAGRRTFEEMEGWFDESHTPLMLSKSPDPAPAVGRHVSSVEEALLLGESSGAEELVCVGGGQTFAAALPLADRLVLTTVHHVFPSDEKSVWFPEYPPAAWKLLSREPFSSDAENPWSFDIGTWTALREPAPGAEV